MARIRSTCTQFASFVYHRSSERLLRHFTSSDENEVIWQTLKWCEENAEFLPVDGDEKERLHSE
jgi:hypothetical protein